MKIRKRFSAVLVFLLLITLVPCVSAADAASEKGIGSYAISDYANNQVLAVYSDGTTQVFSYDSEAELEHGLNTLAGQDDVVWIQPNFTYGNTAETVDDPMYDEQWALSNDGSFQMEEEENQYPVFDQPFGPPAAPGQWGGPRGERMGFGGMAPKSYRTAASSVSAVSGIDINAEEAWQLFDDGSRDVIVALIDTGVDITHEDLSDSIWVNTGEIAGNGIDDDGNGYVDDVYGWDFYDDSNEVYVGSEDDHGTHGAGTIVASSDNGVGIAGLAGDTDHVQLMVLKALGGSDGSGSTEDMIDAIQYAQDNGASIVNLSLGTSTFDYALYLAMKNSDLLFVVAAGNDGADDDETGTYPAAYPLDNIISVANLNCDGTLHSSSNYGIQSVDLAAPGSYILSTTTGSTYSYMTGTSMAAPMVTAAAAMVYSYYDGISLSEVRQILLDTVSSLDSLSGLVATGGMLNVGAALSFDLSNLVESGSESTTDSGTAPVIQLETSQDNDVNLLTLTVTDEDGDLCLVSYAKGEQTAADFDHGAAGTQITLQDDGTAVFRVISGGTYTFYALDLYGNETVQVITLEGQSDSGDSTSTAPGAEFRGGHMPPPGGRFHPQR